MQNFVVSKPFKVIFIDFLLENKNWEIQLSERRTFIFPKKNIYSFARWQTCYGVTVFSVWLYLMLLPPYLAQHQFQFLDKLVLDTNVPLPSLMLPPFIVNLFFHVLTNTTFKPATSTYYHSWYLVFDFIFNVTLLQRELIDI